MRRTLCHTLQTSIACNLLPSMLEIVCTYIQITSAPTVLHGNLPSRRLAPSLSFPNLLLTRLLFDSLPQFAFTLCSTCPNWNLRTPIPSRTTSSPLLHLSLSTEPLNT